MTAVATSTEQIAGWRSRTVPPPEEVRRGLWAVPTPVPTPVGYTLTYVAVAGPGLLVVDPGWPDDDAWQGLREGLAHLGAAPEDVATVVVTHLHPDHVGLAGRILDTAPGAELLMHPADLDRLLPQGQGRRAADDAQWSALMTTVGAPEHLEVGTRKVVTPSFTAAQADRTRPLEHGDVVDHGDWRFEAVWTPGHTRGSVVLHEQEQGLLVTGDHVLPTITPAVTQQNHADHDVLGDFLGSLLTVRDIALDAPDIEVLPGHQYRFRGLVERVEAMCAHHEERLEDLLRAVVATPGASCFDLARRLPWARAGFGDLAPRDQVMAARETLVHLTHLRLAGHVRTLEGPQIPSSCPADRAGGAAVGSTTRWHDAREDLAP